MNSFEKLINEVSTYNKEGIEAITKAYEFAKLMHEGQYRQSGEPYIIHPLNVACILAEIHADTDTICAGLLHDTLEDTPTTKEEISNLFNPSVAFLVDGVTKISKMNFSSKQELNLANTRKIITSITEDVRIIIIKLADRLHNMRTLKYKSEFKQKENSLETMEIFVPLAYSIGAYLLKNELEDLSLRYLKPNIYQNICEKRLLIEADSKKILTEMLTQIKILLDSENIPNDIKMRTKNIYGIYKKLIREKPLNTISDLYALKIHDLFALKIMVDGISNCYHTLGLVHELYHPLNEKFKDYICNPKTNGYRSLHTTVFGPENKLVQTQIRTFDMDKVDSFGLTTYWDIKKGNIRDLMQQALREKYQFFSSISEINASFSDNQEFVNQVKSELFKDKVYVYTTKGDVIEFPRGATPIDFAYRLGTHIGNTMTSCLVNDEYVPFDYKLQNKDRVQIITDERTGGPKEYWQTLAKTTYAKRKILEKIS